MNVARSAGSWLASCSECGLEQAGADEADCWTWLLEHPCAGLGGATTTAVSPTDEPGN